MAVGSEVDGGQESKWWARRDSNPQPSGYEPPALTIELQALPFLRHRVAQWFAGPWPRSNAIRRPPQAVAAFASQSPLTYGGSPTARGITDATLHPFYAPHNGPGPDEV